MLPWIVLIGSAAALTLMFVRRLRLTRHDLRFQEHLAAEEEELEEDLEDEIEHEGEEVKPSSSVRKDYMKADALFSRGDLDKAEDMLLSILAKDESHLDSLHKLGLLYMKREDFPQAELYFSKLVNLKKDPIYFSNLGAALYRQQRLVEAAEAYESAIAMDDKRAARLQSLAQVYFELGDDENALKYFELAARRKPKDLELKMILVDYYDRLERPEEAVEQLKLILEKDPYNKEAEARLKEIG